MADDQFFSSNSLVRQYRKVLEASGKVDDRTDLELTIELGNKLRTSGDFETENKYPDFKEQYLNATQATSRGLGDELGEGLKRGAYGLAATGLGAVALGADLVGAKDTATSLAKKAKSLDSGGDSAPTIARVDDVRDVSSGARYAAGKAGEVIPSIAEAILTSMVGAAAGTAAEPGGGTAAGAVAGLVGKRAVKSMIREGIAKRILGREIAEAGLEQALRAGENKALQAEFVGTAKNIAARMGGEATAALNSLALSTGEIYNSTGDKELALGAGALAALPDTILPAYVVRKFFPTGAVTKEAAEEAGGYLKRLLHEVPKTIPIEASTEAFQELVGIAAEKYKAGSPLTLGQADIDRLKEAAIGGAAGGALAAPLAAAPGGNVETPTTITPAEPAATRRLSAEDARRRVVLGETPRVLPTGVQAAVLMTPEQQRIRLDALEKISTRTKAEDGELEVLRATLGAPAPSSPAPVVTAPPATTAPAAPSPTVALPVPNVALPGTPLVTAPPAAPAAPIAATPIQLGQRVQAAGKKLLQIVNQVPSLDISAVQEKLQAITKTGKVSADDVTALETSLNLIEQQAGVESAARTASQLAKTKAAGEARSKVKDVRLAKQTEKANADLQKLVDTASAKAETAPAVTATPAIPAAPTADLTQRLQAALNPTPAEALVPRTTPFSFGKVTLQSADLRPALTQGAEGMPRPLTAEALKGVNWEKTIDVTGALGDSGDRSKTRIAVALMAPDGRVLLRGLSNYNKAEGLKRVGQNSEASTGPAVQGMGMLKGKLKEHKLVDPAGKQQVLLNDVVAAGYVPIARINFESEPGAIREDFASAAEFDQAWNSTEKVGKAVAVSEAANRQSLPSQVFSQGDDAIAVAEGQQAGAAAPGPTLAATAQQTAEAAKFEAQRSGPTVVVRKVTKQMLADVEAALGKKRLKELTTATLGQPLTERTRIISNELESNTKLAKAGDPTLVEAALHRILKPSEPDRIPGKERRAGKSGSGGGILRAGLALPNTGKVDAKFFERLHQSLTRAGGKFDENFVAAIGTANTERIAKLLEMTGLDWTEFSSRIQQAFDGTGNDAEFAAQLKGELPRLESPNDRATWQAREYRNLQTVIDRLQNAGLNVEVVAKELLSSVPGRVGSYDPVMRNIRIAMEDVANANLGNLVTLIHEVGHDVLRSAGPDVQERLHRAAERALPAITGAANPEEQLVESFATRLAEEGFGGEAPSMAQAIIRSIKDLYLRVAMAVQKALGREPSDQLALSWFENNLRRLVGGDFDYRFTDLFRTLIPEKVADRVRRFERIDGAGIANFLDPLTRSLRQPVVMPDTIEGMEHNLLYRDTPVIGTEADGMDYTEAMARVQAAGWNEILPILAELKKAVGSKLTDKQFWKLFARGDIPTDIMAKIEERVPGATKATIAGEKMTEPMNQRARYNAFRIANLLAVQARRRAASKTEIAIRAANQITESARKLNKIERDFRDADAMNASFNESLKDMVKEFATDIDRGGDTAFAAGKLFGAIREMENLTDDQAIPEEYQRVFNNMLDSDNNSVLEYLTSIAKLDLPLGRMKVSEIVDAIKQNAPSDAKLQALIAQRPLMAALASLARQSTNEMDLLQLKMTKDTATYLAIKGDLDQIRTANDEKLIELTDAWKTAQGNQGLRDRLRKGFIDARREFRNKQKVIQRAEENGMITREVAEKMGQKATDLSRDVGAFSYWEPTNGAKYKALSLGDDGKWSSVDRTLRMVGNDVTEQFEQVRHDVRYNNLWLEQHKSEAGTRLYEEVKRQTEELSLIDISKQAQASHRFWLDKMLQPVGQKFAGTGTTSGGRVQQMLNRFQFISRTHGDEIESKSRRWTKSLQEASEAAGYAYYKQFFQDVYDQVIYHIESQPGLEEKAALREGVRAAERRIPAGFKVADNFPEKLEALLRNTKEISETLNRVAEQNGVYIEDKRIRDPLTQKGNLQRHSIKYGWLTSTRKLRASLIQTLVHDMQAAGWNDQMFTDLAPAQMDDAQFQEIAAQYFTRGVVRDFVEPFIQKPGKEVFFGVGEKNVTQIEAQQAWEESEGSVAAFIDHLYDQTAGEKSDKGQYRVAMLKRFANLYQMESKIAAESSQAKNIYDPHGPKAHRLMDGRTNDLIPPKHFQYDTFDPASARIALGEIAFHSSFGRNGKGLDATLADLKSDLSEKKRRYDMLPTGSKALKRAAAEARGWNYTELERASRDYQRVDGWMNEVGTYFGGGNQGGAVGDAKALLELMSLNMGLVLNQPKSGLWNLLSLADFPIAFRGLGKASLKASAFALQNLTRNVLGSGLEAMGINILRAGEYGREIGEVYESRQTERLPWGVAIADIGKGGQYQEGGVTNKTVEAVRGIQQTLKKGVKLGPGQGQFAGFNALWAPFNYINQQVASSIATANVQTFETIIRNAIGYFAEHPEAERDPAFRLSAEHLGMKGSTWFSDEGAFDFFRDKASEYRLGSIEDIARQAAKQQAMGKRLLTREQALGVAQMAMNEISLESSINSRPVEMFNNPILHLGGLMLGWPLAKMNQVNQSLKTSAGQVEAMSVLKGLGVLAAWTLPVGLAYSLLMDHYDEKILGKKSNLRGIDTIAAVPLIGPALAAMGIGGDRSGKENILGMLERTARAGNAYGLMADFVNSSVNTIDPTSGQRDFSLDSRVLIFSQFSNLRDALRNFVQSDYSATYQTVGRPLLATMGGNGLLQYQQIANKLFGLDNNEARVTARTNVGNWLRAAGRETGVELRAGAGKSSVTPTSVWVREMQLAAYGNDRMGFLEAYRNAVDAARKAGEEDPEKKVLESWKSRDPLASVFRQKPSDVEMSKMLGVMDEDGRRAVREATNLYGEFTEMIAPNHLVQVLQNRMKQSMRSAAGLTPEQIRRKAALQATGF